MPLPDRIEDPARGAVIAALLAARPSLRAFAISLCGDAVRADDLMQETLLRALANLDSFEPGTNMAAWLFTILRNSFRSEYRKRRREVEDKNGVLGGVDVATLTDAKAMQYWYPMLGVGSEEDEVARLDYARLQELLDQLSADLREALVAVCVGGMSYDGAADVLGVAVGTIKSRVSRARAKLAELMGEYEVRGFDEPATEESEAWRRLLRSGAVDEFWEDYEDA